MLKNRGFGLRWLSYILAILLNSKSAIFFNGRAENWFVDQNSVKQGNPIAPLLFNLVIDTLDRILTQAAAEGLITGVGSSETMGNIRSLHFADDTLLLCNYSKLHIQNSNLSFMPLSL